MNTARPLEKGEHAAGATFGGASWLAMEQSGGIPALSVSNRLRVYDSHLDEVTELHENAGGPASA